MLAVAEWLGARLWIAIREFNSRRSTQIEARYASGLSGLILDQVFIGSNPIRAMVC